MEKLIEKAHILIEALPFIRSFYGKTFVIKYGGAAQVEDALKDSFAQDIVLLNFIGIKPVIVHGGGPKISQTMKKMGKEPTFIQGQRVTDRETMDIVEMVLGGLINKEIVALINSHGGKAIGLSGKDGRLIRAKKKLLKKSAATGEDELIDIGLVGEVDSIDPDILNSLEKGGFIPVISPIGVGNKGEAFNINADYVASAIASSLKAEKFILLTDVAGVLDAKGERISTMTEKEAVAAIRSGEITGGMIPKVECGLVALGNGVRKVHVIDGRVPHSVLLEIFTDAGVGTEIVRGGKGAARK